MVCLFYCSVLKGFTRQVFRFLRLTVGVSGYGQWTTPSFSAGLVRPHTGHYRMPRTLDSDLTPRG